MRTEETTKRAAVLRIVSHCRRVGLNPFIAVELHEPKVLRFSFAYQDEFICREFEWVIFPVWESYCCNFSICSSRTGSWEDSGRPTYVLAHECLQGTKPNFRILRYPDLKSELRTAMTTLKRDPGDMPDLAEPCLKLIYTASFVNPA